MEDDDLDLVARIRKGAMDEFGELVRRHQSFVFAVLYRYERDYQKLEDLAQETFIKVWRSLDQFDARAPFRHWLAKIASHAAVDYLRKQRRVQNEIRLGELGDDALDWLQQEEPRSELESRQAAELLALAMRALSPAERVVITLQELEGRSVKDICSLTGSSSVAVRVRALRARARLRKSLEQLQKNEVKRKEAAKIT